MRTFFILLLLALLVTVVVLIRADRTPTSTLPTAEIAMLRDVTAKNFMQPNPDEIFPLFDLTSSPNHGAIFRFADISDVSYNQTKQVKITATGKWLSNEFDRQKEIDAFLKSAATICRESQNDTLGKDRSSVYLPVARELIRLSQSASQRRILIVYSDLMENGTAISFYHSKEMKRLQSNPETIKKNLEEMAALPRLDGIEVLFIYQPITAQDDATYRVVSEFYKTMLQDKGARVTIEANLQN